jgi:trk system potassium uptake protein TrkH
MHYKAFLKTTSALLVVGAGLMTIPATCAWIYDEGDFAAFAWTILGSVLLGGPTFFLLRSKQRMSVKEEFVLVVIGWLLITAVSSIPFVLHGAIPSFTDAFFEVMSGYTTTGSTLLTDIEALPKGLLFWRNMTHFIGGMGMIVLYLTLFSGAGSTRLFRAEAAPGQGLTGVKMLPRLQETLRWLWVIYVGLNVVATLIFWAGGMSLYDALIHASSAVATGGFSSRNASFGHFNSAYLDWMVILFMFIGGMDFVLHFQLISRNWEEVWNNTEIKAYLGVVMVLCVGVSWFLWESGTYASIAEACRYGFFQVVSIITTTGFATADYELWPHTSQILIFLCLFIGASSSSTTSGIRIIHLVIIWRSISHTARTLLQPMAVNPIQINRRPLPPVIINGVVAFFTLHILCLLLGSVLLTFLDPRDFWSSLNAVMATLWNNGPAFSTVGPTDNFSHFSDPATWLLSFAMLAGRLDLYTVLIFFFPSFWRS